jgi:outer membrane protein assembly factor BamB
MHAHATGNTLHLPSGKSVRFDAPLLTVVELGGVIVVVLAQPEGRDMPENVYAVDDSGRVIWRISTRDFPEGPDYYVGASAAGSAVRLIHFSGFVLDVDPSTGRVLAQRFVK